MPVLAIDIETFGSTDLIKCGLYPYTEDQEFEIMLFAYAFDDEPVEIIDFTAGEILPGRVKEAFTDSDTTLTAYNAQFERVCLDVFGYHTQISKWICSQACAAMMGLPHSLEATAKALGLPEDQQKLQTGKALIKYFSVPCVATARNGHRSRNYPQHDFAKWDLFKKYCMQDVEAERAVRKTLAKYKVTKAEKAVYGLDQEINASGVKVDLGLVQQALAFDLKYRCELEEEAIRLSGIDNPHSVSQLKAWLYKADGVEVESLSKAIVPDLIAQTGNGVVKRVLELRQEMAKTSIRKYEAINKTVCADSRVRGLFQYYGANRSGRWAGRRVQVQNLPQNKMPDLGLARELVKDGEYDVIKLLYHSTSDVLSQLIRTAFIPADGYRFIIADFSAIEARVLAWLAGEEWVLEVFKTHGKIYEAAASQMFRTPIDRIKKGNPEYALRQKGKVAVLACGYGGGQNALIAMGALKMGLAEDELPEIITNWRKANPKIVQFWRKCENTAIMAVEDRQETRVGCLRFGCSEDWFFITLPSERKLAYFKPQIKEGHYGPQLTYAGIEQGLWKRINTYGGKLAENITQGVARDCLAFAMLRVRAAGYGLVMHVHDEIIIEALLGTGSLKEVCEIMGKPFGWAPGLPLKADGFETAEFYMKE